MSSPANQPEFLKWGTRKARIALAATICGSGLAFLDGSVVAVAVPAIERDLGGGLATTQWVFDGYLLTLGAFVLVGGALGDLIGKRRVFIVGTLGFGLASVLCGLAPTATTLVGARMIQGLMAALMVPTSLAILNAVFTGGDRGKAIGAWSGLAGVFTALGPVVGGLLVESSDIGWRLVFLINVPLVIGAVWLAKIGVPDLPGSRKPSPLLAQVDVIGGLLAIVGLGLVVGPLIEVQRLGGVLTFALVGAGAVCLVGFVALERHRERTLHPPPMMPTKLFAVRTFTVANAVTFVVYGALGAAFFLVTIALQTGLGYSPVVAGLSGLPVTIILALGSSKVGGLLPKLGARPLLTVGPLIMAVGMLWLGVIEPGENYWLTVCLGFVIFALGLVLVVAPVTATALGDVGGALSGTASGINNAVARIASLAAIAVLPLIGGLAASAATSLDGAAFMNGYRNAMYAAAIMCALGGLLALAAFRKQDGRLTPDEVPAEAG